jgi:hypothetical protein
MHRYVKIFGIALFAGPGIAGAQGGTVDVQCRAGTVAERATQDACQKAVDLFQFMTPQLGASLIGGNIVLGEAKALGGFGHFSLGLRANGMKARLPRADQVTPAIAGAVSTSFPVKDTPWALPAVDVALGILPGASIGRLTVLGLDALINVAYLPEVTSGDLALRLPDGSLRLGFGARLSVVEESDFTPSVSVSYLQRDLPSLDLTATPGSDELGVTRFSLTTDAWRAVIGKSVGPFTLAVGGGRDHYDASATVDVTVNRAGQAFMLTGFDVGQSLDRQTVFADLAINFPLVKLVAEVGQVSGGSLATYNTFGTTRADDALQFASLGLRLRW